MNKGLSGVRADRKYSYRALEKIAECVRQQLEYTPDDLAIDASRLFENLDEISIELSGGVVIPLRGGVVALEDSEGYTRYNHKQNVIEMLASERTYELLEQGYARAGFFVAHELGHCVLHTDQLVRLAQMPTKLQTAFHRGQADHKPFEDTEWQANAFAGALLMPAKAIEILERDRGCVTPSLVANQFAVSVEAAQYRLNTYRNRREELLS